MKHVAEAIMTGDRSGREAVVLNAYPPTSPLPARRRSGPVGGLHILLLEDDPADVELAKHALSDSGLELDFVVVDNRVAFEAELTHRPPGLILADYLLPNFDGGAALMIAKKKVPHVPFIFVTGVLGEEVAIEMLKQGAADYVLKSHLGRLVPAVKWALRETQQRRERERTEEKLRNSHEQLRALNTHLQRVREEERTRIAREIHDELGQALTGLKLDLSWLAVKLPRGARPLLRKIKTMSEHIDSTIHAIRRVATELRPGILDSLGLIAAIEWQANEFQERSGVFCEVKIEVAEAPLEPELTTACFRIFQETLTNIIRHAHATHVEVTLAHDGEALVLTVRDNGRGISEKEIVNAASIGLIGMRERAADVGGDVLFFGLPGQGTTVTIRLPTFAPVAPKEVSP